jgi:glycosyltransferase involved in cell wall biosynthesis
MEIIYRGDLVANIMFLTHRMSMGFGVSVVVDELSKKLVQMGHYISICSMIVDYKIPGVEMFVTQPDHGHISQIAREKNIDVIIAQTTPFFETLPFLSIEFKCWAWENGDPSYQFFPEDGEERLKIINNKQKNVYNQVSGVFAISEFIREDIEYPNSCIIYLGADHLLDYGKKTSFDFRNETEPLRIGTLTRLGKAESLYKGSNLYIELCERIKKENINAEFYVMGRGSAEDAKEFQKNGFKVYRNASDEERAKYLRDLDIFISPSLWEGFNLPIVEAMKSGTMTMVFDTGAHPEVCPFIFSGIDEMVTAIKYHVKNRKLLLENSERCYNYVNKMFLWERTASSLLSVLFKNGQLNRNSTPSAIINAPVQVISKPEGNFKKGVKSLRQDGIRKTFRKVKRVIRG